MHTKFADNTKSGGLVPPVTVERPQGWCAQAAKRTNHSLGCIRSCTASQPLGWIKYLGPDISSKFYIFHA